jgi:hypothetical protein
MSKKIRKELKLTIAFQPSRVEEEHLQRVYELVVPQMKQEIDLEQHSHEKFFLGQKQKES